MFIRSSTQTPEPNRVSRNESPKFISEYGNRLMPITYNMHNDGTRRDIPSKEQLIRSIGDYTFIRTLGSGSTGKVKLAKHKITGELIAIKIVNRRKIRLAVEASKKSQKRHESVEHKENRILREALIMHLMNHQNIVKLKDFLTTSDWFIMLFEYVEGVQLLDFIVSNSKLKERTARKLFRQLLSAVYYTHKNSVVHRDLKIENILIRSDDGCLKLLDFGLSNFYQPNQLLRTYCGSLYFAAPELLHGRPYRGPEIDVWSLGVILYVMVTGRVPFDNQNINKLHELIKKGEFKCPGEMSPEIKELLEKMICVDPFQRATMPQVITDKWVTSNGEEPIMESHIGTDPCLVLDLETVNYLKRHVNFEFPPEDIEHILQGYMAQRSGAMSHHPLTSLYQLYIQDRELKKSRKEEKASADYDTSFVNINLEERPERPRSISVPASQGEFAAVQIPRRSSDGDQPTRTDSPLSKDDLLPLKSVYLRGLFSSRVSSAKSPQILKHRIVQALNDLHIDFEDHLDHIICKHHPSITTFIEDNELSEDHISFQIVMVRVILFGSFGIQVKRLAGSYVPYKRVVSLLLSKIK
jgi:serine/threonine protein kinase